MNKLLNILILSFFLIFTESNADWKKVFKYDSKYAMPQWDLDCADKMNCISVASLGPSDSRFLRTTDGGNNWVVQFADTQKVVYNDQGQIIDVIDSKFKGAICINYITPTFAITGNREGQITITRDGGVSWNSIQLNTTRNIKKIHFIDENYGVAFAYSDIFRTYDSGYNWEKIDLSYKNELKTYEANIAVVGKDSLILVVYDETDTTHKFYTTYRTYDGGKSWDAGSKIPKYDEWVPYFLDMDQGWLAGRVGAGSNIDYDVIFHTTNGGHSWELQLDTLQLPQLGLQGIYFKDANEGISWGQGGKIWRSSDGGKNWILDESFPFEQSDHFQQLAFPNKDTKKILANVLMFGEIWMYEETTDVDEINKSVNNMLIYPNPAGDYIQIQPTIGFEIQIFDMLGINVSPAGGGIKGGGKIDISNLAPGIYFIKIGNKVEKFVKM
jgi:photosystem II stability/assembly factor-like uncharacterized protein